MLLLPAIDLKDGQCVRLRQGRMEDTTVFSDSPVDTATRWVEAGAKRLHLVDLNGAFDGVPVNNSAVEAIAKKFPDLPIQIGGVFIPLTVGGGIRKVEDVRTMLNAGADKVAINTAAIFNPELVKEAVAIDAKKTSKDGESDRWELFTHGGRKETGIDAVEWAKKMEAYGAGELLVTSMDKDGTKSGFNLPLTKAIVDAVNIPVIASGGVGNLQHLADGVLQAGADAVLAASIFHFSEYTVGEAKQYMSEQGIEMRI
ncbi:UNVERIFIED_CONTAM: hypothetical protein GTU68_022770 [Idotea baltica]|nr:hypothetical protein [Idotea baltica]